LNDAHPFLKLGQKAVFRLGAVANPQFVTDGLPQVAFAGRSNVGKSSLQNALLGRSGLVRVSRTPGRTREINFFELPGSGWFVDLPGFGFARGGVSASAGFAGLVGEYLSQLGQPGLLFYILDAGVVDGEVDEICLGRILEAGVPCQVLLNKADRLDQSAKARVRRDVAAKFGLAEPPPLVSARTGQGLDPLRDRILGILRAEPPGSVP
jgi:GTP-binding protein